MSDGDYIDFSKTDKDRYIYPVNEMQAGMDMVGVIHHFLRKDFGWQRDEIEKLREQFSIHMSKVPHKHYSSILGPYCVVCRCHLPGPNGEWE